MRTKITRFLIFSPVTAYRLRPTTAKYANIGQYCNRPDGWQDPIIENWNRFIQPGETVFHLGDLALGKKGDAEALVPQLNGKLYLMRCNHECRGKAFYANLGITLVKDSYSMVYSSVQRRIFSHRPISPLEPGVLNLHRHIHKNRSPDVGPRHINLSVEVREYRPWRLGDILQSYVGNKRLLINTWNPTENLSAGLVQVFWLNARINVVFEA